MNTPTEEQITEWLSRMDLVMSLEGGEITEERLFICLGVDEEYRVWAQSNLWTHIQQNTSYLVRSSFGGNHMYWYYSRITPLEELYLRESEK
jgi:hypothetical protein